MWKSPSSKKNNSLELMKKKKVPEIHHKNLWPGGNTALCCINWAHGGPKEKNQNHPNTECQFTVLRTFTVANSYSCTTSCRWLSSHAKGKIIYDRMQGVRLYWVLWLMEEWPRLYTSLEKSLQPIAIFWHLGYVLWAP